MKKCCPFWLLIFAFLNLSVPYIISQGVVEPNSFNTNAASPERYLIAVDTSLSMARLSDNVSQFVHDLVLTGLQRRMRSGDVFTLWTFNEQVATSRFIAQDWDEKLHQALANNVLRYLQDIRWEKMTRFDRFMSFLNQHLTTLDKLTIIIISDGTDKFRGTPFDDAINSLFKEHYRDLRKAKRAFVITLVASKSKFLAYSVSASGDAIGFDELTRLANLALSKNAATNSVPIASPPLAAGTNDTPVRVTTTEVPTTVVSVTNQTTQPVIGSETNITSNQRQPTFVEETTDNPVEQIKISPPPLIKKEATNIVLTSSNISTNPPPSQDTISIKPPAEASLQETNRTPSTARITVPIVPETMKTNHEIVKSAAISTNKNVVTNISNSTQPKGASISDKIKPLQSTIVDPAPHKYAYIIAGIILLICSLMLSIWWYRRQQSPKPVSFISQSIEREINPFKKD